MNFDWSDVRKSVRKETHLVFLDDMESLDADNGLVQLETVLTVCGIQSPVHRPDNQPRVEFADGVLTFIPDRLVMLAWDWHELAMQEFDARQQGEDVELYPYTCPACITGFYAWLEIHGLVKDATDDKRLE